VGFFSVALSGQTARPPALLGTAEFRLSSAGGGCVVWGQQGFTNTDILTSFYRNVRYITCSRLGTLNQIRLCAVSQNGAGSAQLYFIWVLLS